tara:strand:+ start:55 stop:522 length:468 start_codon:yes stop_codon:yes gene_type:complete
MKKKFNFGKIDYNNNGRKENLVTVEVKFENGCFSASGNIWNRLGTDLITCGQCINTINQYLKDNKLFNCIYEIWKEYHLNDLTAGSPKQEKFVKKLLTSDRDGYRFRYEEICKRLDQADLLTDNSYLHNGKPYRYGSAWLKTKIPSEVQKQIRTL